jgi:hypothetical protein
MSMQGVPKRFTRLLEIFVAMDARCSKKKALLVDYAVIPSSILRPMLVTNFLVTVQRAIGAC